MLPESTSPISVNIDTIPDENLGMDRESIKKSLVKRLTYSVGKDNYTATLRDWLHALMYVVRDRLIERWMGTMRHYYRVDTKRVYYLSLEFLIGRTLLNSVINMGFYEECRAALADFDINMEHLCELEFDAALGNGGLGRLAACFLDSMATLQLAGYGYGIRYEYGMFRQEIEHGNQVEHPDNWLRYNNLWEFPRPEVLYPVKFYGHVVSFQDEQGALRHQWCDTADVMAMAYDTPIPGYQNATVNNMRLWSAKATRDFDLQYFNEGNYIKAVEAKNQTENLSKVLYPDDTTQMGRTLRLKQQYFFVSASLQDILFRFCKQHGNFDQLPDKVAIQLNDTHPAIAIPELMHILIDKHGVHWDHAWHLTRQVFSYTNHTLLPEALESWPVHLLETLLPRHMQLIYEINHWLMKEVMHWRPGDTHLLRRMSIISEDGIRSVRMAHLAITGSHKVNGVAALHTQLMCDTIFSDFNTMTPEKFVNITNGITPRRWLKLANPNLAQLINKTISSQRDYSWVRNLGELEHLTKFANDDGFQQEFQAVKFANKTRLAHLIRERININIDPASLFDVHVKRIHEYKRQLMNVLHAISLYNRIRDQHTDITPRTVIFSGKAAPGYYLAKLIIKLINDVADVVNHDPNVRDLLKIAFIPNYDVSTAISIIPAADLSEQISTAGMEASGTGNMKLALNGALTIGTLDGANIEIRDAVGADHFFLFGLTAQEVAEHKANYYRPRDYYESDDELRRVIDMLSSGYFSPDDPQRFMPIIDALLNHGDRYMVLADYRSYIDTQRRVDALYTQPKAWVQSAIINVANMGYFSTDRTISEYAKKVWHINQVHCE